MEKIKAIADEVRTITIDEAKKLPGLLGFVAAIELKKSGFYAYTNTTTNKKVFLALA